MHDTPQNFGKDIGLLHEIISGGRSLHLGRQWWKQFLETSTLEDVAEYLSAMQFFNVPILKPGSFVELLNKFPGRTDMAIYPQDKERAWWVPSTESTEGTLRMSLFRGRDLASEEHTRQKLADWNLRPADTLELVSAALALNELFYRLPRLEILPPIENGIESHIVALNAKRIDGEEQEMRLGMEVNHIPNPLWCLERYDPAGNPGFWRPKTSQQVFFLAVQMA